VHILILSFFYSPEPNDIKIHRLGKELVQRGHTVTAITTFPNYPLGRVYSGYRQRLWQRECIDGIQVLRLPLYPDHSRSGVRRAASYLSFAVTASVLGPMLSGSIDVMWVYQPPLTTGIPGCWISWLRNVPFVYEIQDLWPETVVATGMLANKSAIRLLDRLATFIYRRAAALTVNSPGFKQKLIGKGASADKIQVIPNWADEEIYRPLLPDQQLGEQYGLIDRFNVIFGGNMGPAQGLQTTLEAAILLQDLGQIQFVFIGDGIDLPALQAAAQRRQLTNVRFIERQPPGRMPYFFAWADALLVQLRNDPLFAITIPAKTTAYLACGRPILCAVPGDGADVIRQTKSGLTCPPEDPQALAETVRALYHMSPLEREEMGRAGRQAFLEQYRCQVLIDRYENLFHAVIERH
jgi:glycosyltransferase involved in cell wall biosynthesis